MWERPLQELDEAAIRQLEQGQVSENLRLEFKRDLNLSTTSERREVAKDVSALANTAGGRLVYGIDEAELQDGTVVAGPVVPLTDGALIDVLPDVIYSAIHPRPSIQLARVPLSSGGFVLVVEIAPSLAGDLHMVTGYKDFRFYRRGPRGVVVMTEPEVREAYVRIASVRAQLETRLGELATKELALRATVDESIIVMPWYAKPGLLVPRQLGEFPARLARTIEIREIQEDVAYMQLGVDGYRLLTAESAQTSNYYIAVLKNGIVHYSTNSAIDKRTGPNDTNHYHWWYGRSVYRILKTLIIAYHALREGQYWGPVRVIYRLRTPNELTVEPVRLRIPAGVYDSDVPEVNLEASIGQFELIARDLIDPVFHATGRLSAPVFMPDGRLINTFFDEPDVFRRYVRI